jgi:UDP-N-acetyl-2-amino-2-deoxyglucuronate dehydrogenase
LTSTTFPLRLGRRGKGLTITLDGEEIEFSRGFTDLHTLVYQQTLAGQGFGLEEAKIAIQIVHDIQNTAPTGIHYNSHPILKGLRNWLLEK